MDKAEFLNQLRVSLSGRMDAESVTDNLRYYEDYINTQVRLGRRESDVLASLGAPRLIARTILDAQSSRADAKDTYGGSYEGNRARAAERRIGHSGRRSFSLLSKFFAMPKPLRIVLGAGVGIVVIWSLCTLLSFLLPLLLPAVIVMLLFKMFRDWLK